MTVLIHPATSKDFPALLELQVTCISGLNATYTAEEIRNWINYLKSEGASRYALYNNLVWARKGKVYGFVSWSRNDASQEATIECLYRRQDLHGGGIGGQLLQAAEVQLPPKTMVYVRSTLNARSFYEHKGYAYVENVVSRSGFSAVLLQKYLV